MAQDADGHMSDALCFYGYSGLLVEGLADDAPADALSGAGHEGSARQGGQGTGPVCGT